MPLIRLIAAGRNKIHDGRDCVSFLAHSGALLLMLLDFCDRPGRHVPPVEPDTVKRLREISRSFPDEFPAKKQGGGLSPDQIAALRGSRADLRIQQRGSVRNTSIPISAIVVVIPITSPTAPNNSGTVKLQTELIV